MVLAAGCTGQEASAEEELATVTQVQAAEGEQVPGTGTSTPWEVGVACRTGDKGVAFRTGRPTGAGRASWGTQLATGAVLLRGEAGTGSSEDEEAAKRTLGGSLVSRTDGCSAKLSICWLESAAPGLLLVIGRCTISSASAECTTFLLSLGFLILRTGVQMGRTSVIASDGCEEEK